MSDSAGPMRRVLRRALGRVRVDGAVAVALGVAALVPLALVVAFLGGGWSVQGLGPLTLWGLVTAVAVVGGAILGRRWIVAVDEGAIAAAAERARDIPDGALRGVLELGRELPHGASRALFERSESELARRLEGVSAWELAGELGVAARRRRVRLLGVGAALGILVSVAGFAAPERARAAWTPLLHPVEHLRGPVLPALVVAPGDSAVERGLPLSVRIEAPGRTHVVVHSRSVGDVPGAQRVAVEAGQASASIGPVDSELTYWVRAPDGATSDTFTATPRDPLLVTALTLDVVYPPHVGRAPDHYRGDPPALRVPEGTRVTVTGRTSGALAVARVRHETGAERAATVDGTGFVLDWTLAPVASGRWDWSLVGPGGETARTPPPLDIQVGEDAAPSVRITFPGADTILPGSFRQPILADASDDYGLTSATLVYRRVDGRGERGPPVSRALPVAATDGRAALRGILDASDQPLVPGDAVEYHVAVRDNSPGRQVGRSATYRLRLPSMTELRDRARRESHEVLETARRLADRTRELETGTRDLSRGVAGGGPAVRSPGEPGGARSSEPVGFREASEARDLAGSHEEVLSQIAEIRARMEALDRAIEEAGLRDPALQRRLSELQELYDRLETPELRESVEALRQAVEALDPAAVREALERLAERQGELRRQVAESLETMRRAAAEQELNALARQAEEIAARQEALAAAMAVEAGDGAEEGSSSESNPAGSAGESAGESPGASPIPELPEPPSVSLESRAEQQDNLEAEAEALTVSLQSLQRQLMQMGEASASSQAGAARDQGKASQQSMQQAAEEARGNQGAEAAASGERAAGQMADAARTMDDARQRMTEARQRAARESVQQATQEALGMAERQEALRQEMERAQRRGQTEGASRQEMRSEQAALQASLEQLNRNLTETGQRSSRVDRPVRQALERSRMSMGRTAEGLGQGGRMPVREAAETVESLNQLAMALLENDATMARAEAPGGMQEALRQLAQAAQEQGSLNGRASALAPMDLAESVMTEQIRQVADQQRGVARRIGEVSGMLGGSEDVLGRLDQLSGEAARIARELDGGRLEPEVMARQERLFHRLLDAGRSLEREEYSDERVGEAPGHTEVSPVEALDPSLVAPAVRYPAPTAEQLDGLPPAYRRLILEYFDRLNRGGGGGD